MRENKKISSYLNHFQRTSATRTSYLLSEEKKKANISGLSFFFFFWLKRKCYKCIHFQTEMQGHFISLLNASPNFSGVATLKGYKLSCNKIDIIFNCFLSALSHICTKKSGMENYYLQFWTAFILSSFYNVRCFCIERKYTGAAMWGKKSYKLSGVLETLYGYLCK